MPDFFEPGHLRGQFADFCIELIQVLFVACFESRERILFFKEARQVMKGYAFPLVQLARMHPVLRCDLRNRFVFLQ